MADVLSQSQIDALLKSMHDETPSAGGQTSAESKLEAAEEKKYNKYDFYSPRKFTKEKMKILTNAFENYARILTSQVNGIFRAMTDITVLDVQERRYYEYANAFHESDCMTLINVSVQDHGKGNVPMMMYVTPGLVITLISHMLGGGDEVITVKPGYRYSDVEKALYRRVVDYFTAALKDGFANYINAAFKVVSIEENPSMLQEVGLDETVGIIHLNVDVAGLAVEKIRICMPGTLLEFIFHMIDRRKHIARGFSYEDNKDIIMDNIRYSTLPITGQLGNVILDISDLYHLKVGDVIDLNKPKNSDVKLFVGRQPWFTGQLGVYKKNVAVRINTRIYEEQEEQPESMNLWKPEEPEEAEEDMDSELFSEEES